MTTADNDLIWQKINNYGAIACAGQEPAGMLSVAEPPAPEFFCGIAGFAARRLMEPEA